MNKALFLLIASSTFMFSNQSRGQITPPYFNFFSNYEDSVGWSHYSISGVDDWDFGVPDYLDFAPATGQLAWATNLTGDATTNSDRALETPFFNLSDTTQQLTLSFYQRRIGGNAKFEFSVDGGENWALLIDPENNDSKWQDENGFSNSFENYYKISRVSLASLLGNDNVKFRFRLTTNTIEYSGWIIDDFQIRPTSHDLEVLQGDTIWNINKYTESINLRIDYVPQSDWQSSDLNPVQIDIYFSTDSTLDSSDSLLLSTEEALFWAITFSNFENFEVDLPDDLWSGFYHFIYVFTPPVTTSETIVKNYTVMYVDSIFETPYKTDFESSIQHWGTGEYNNDLKWKKGNANFFGMEQAKSGQNGWYTSHFGSSETLETPFFDLSESTDNVICFWYRIFGGEIDETQPLVLSYPADGSVAGIPPDFPSSSIEQNIRSERAYTWDCHCETIFEFNGALDFRFLFRESDQGYTSIFIDDFYLGPSLPDLALIGDHNFRFTSTQRTTDTLSYILANGGMSMAPFSETEFYWSDDDVLDIGDVLLGSKTEPFLQDTSLIMRHFVYDKPTTSPGTYYIIYKLDADNDINEMWESTNIGALKIEQRPTMPLPYLNDFETQHEQWTHTATVGNDEWVRAAPQGEEFNEAFSGNLAFVTNDTGLVSQESRMHLLSPVFDLTQLDHPVLEFNLKFNTRCNIMCSVNGGATWNALIVHGESNKGMLDGEVISNFSGDMNVIATGQTPNDIDILYGLHEPYFDPFLGGIYDTYKYYDSYENHVLDLFHLSSHSQVQFMFVAANWDSETEGAMVDDFRISEAKPDLTTIGSRSLMTHSSDTKFIHNFVLKNEGNYISSFSDVHLYFSEDDQLSDDDFLLASKTIPEIGPYAKSYFNVEESVPENFDAMNFLLVNVDEHESLIESNEDNNLGVYPLSMDTAVSIQVPIFNDFNELTVDGWAWLHDSTGVYDSQKVHLRHAGEELEISNPYSEIESGMWWTEKMNQWNSDVNDYPTYFLYSPPYDFSDVLLDSISFDLLCMGASWGLETEGGNLQYSLDGGQIWHVLQNASAFNSTNWYDTDEILTLDGQPGWADVYNLTYTSRPLEFLSGASYVKFRFQFRSTYLGLGSGGPHGFRLDNFRITGQNITTLLDPIYVCPGEYALVLGEWEVGEGLYTQFMLNTNGEDSIVGQQIIHLPTYSMNESDTICEGADYTFPDGNTMTQINGSISYASELESMDGCDSTIVTDVSIIEIDPTISVLGIFLKANHSVGHFKWFNCATDEVIQDSESPYLSTVGLPEGVYAAEITYEGCVDTTECFYFMQTGIEDHFNVANITVSPLPTTGRVNVQFNQPLGKIYWELIDITSRRVDFGYSRNPTGFSFTINDESGSYFLKMRNQNGSEIIAKIIKQ